MPSGILADLFALAPCDVVGVWSGSLTMIADVSRGAVLIGLSVFSPTAPRRINRGRYGLAADGTAMAVAAARVTLNFALNAFQFFAIRGAARDRSTGDPTVATSRNCGISTT